MVTEAEARGQSGCRCWVAGREDGGGATGPSVAPRDAGQGRGQTSPAPPDGTAPSASRRRPAETGLGFRGSIRGGEASVLFQLLSLGFT